MNYNWHDLNVILTMRNERQVKAMLDEEVLVHKRPTYLVRIHQRYTTLRAQRERKELLERIKK
jgi:ribosomal silencing factor RsfS